MQVNIEDVSPVEKKMSVEIPWETVSEKLGNAYRELGKGVALKGFRKGKVPRPVLEQVYGQRVNYEVANELVNESFYAANQQHNLAAVAPPRVSEATPIKKGSPFAFKAIIEVRGEVVPQDYKQLPIERRKLAIPETAVEEALATLRREHTELKPIEGRDTTQLGDIVGLSVTGTIGEHTINQPEFAVDLEDKDREPLPGMAEALTGIPIETKDKVLEFDVPADHKDDQLKGRHAHLTISVLEVRQKDVPALDDEFAKDTGKAETLDGLRAALRKDLEDREQQVIDREARENVLRELIKKNQIPVASSLVERAVEMQYQRLRQMLGMKPDKNDRNAGLTDDLREKLRPAGTDEVRGQLLLESIADKENVAVTDEEIGAHVEVTAKGRNMPPAKLRAEWQRDGRLDNVVYSLRQDKVLRFLGENATITEVEKLTQQGTPVPEAPSHGEEGHVHGPDCDH